MFERADSQIPDILRSLRCCELHLSDSEIEASIPGADSRPLASLSSAHFLPEAACPWAAGLKIEVQGLPSLTV